MTKPVILLFVLLISGCGINNQQGNSSTKTPVERSASPFATDTFYLCEKCVKIDTITKDIFGEIAAVVDDTTEANKDPETVRRTLDTLTIVTPKRLSRLININADNDSASRYFYQYLDRNIDQHVILGTFYEWFYYVLIDKNTGDTTCTCGKPVMSPDRRYFICGNSDLEAGETFNGFQLYANTSPPKLLCERALEKWGPEKIRWPDDKTLLIEASIFDTTGIRPIYLKLSFK